MRLTVISDTHGEHEKLGVLSGDVLIHCGDMFNMFRSQEDEFERMDDWFGRQDFHLILCTGGNHDFALQDRSKFESRPFENAVYLQDRSYIHEGITFYGAPWISDLKGQAFFTRSSELADRWSEIPSGTDVLITHTPPAGVLDVSSSGLELGCKHLAGMVQEVSPRVHCFGHVHASSGILEANETLFINASMVNSQYELTRRPREYVLSL
jgi:Icc-related predicted phosphoesterase